MFIGTVYWSVDKKTPTEEWITQNQFNFHKIYKDDYSQILQPFGLLHILKLSLQVKDLFLLLLGGQLESLLHQSFTAFINLESDLVCNSLFQELSDICYLFIFKPLHPHYPEGSLELFNIMQYPFLRECFNLEEIAPQHFARFTAS